MYCTKCGAELREDDRYCSRCGYVAAGRVGTSTGDFTPGFPPHLMPRLMLDKRNGKVGGVCAGFARYFEVDVILMRVIWLCVALVTGVGFLAYLAAWLVMPSDAGYASPVHV